MASSAVRRRRSALAAGLATIVMTLGFTALPAEAAPLPPKVDYVALGDSYTAGTGAGPFDPSTFPCLKSYPGYVDLVGKTGRVNLIENAACHGALLLDPVNISFVPSVSEQIAGASAHLAAAELVSITAGANDIDFGAVVLTCTNPAADCGAAIANAQAKFAGLAPQLVATYAAIRQAAPSAKIAVIGYPRLFDPAVGIPGIDSSVLYALNAAGDALNGVVAGAASVAGVDFIDVSARFTGHAANSADPWIVLDLSNLSLPQNLHPNQAGHRAYASALLGAAKPAQLARQ